MIGNEMIDNEFFTNNKRNYVRFMQWDITKKCNLQCTHCRSTAYYEGEKGHRITDLSTEEIKTTMIKLAKNGVNRIHFLGGEPFMRKDLLEVIRFAFSLGIVCSINTNATLLTDDIIDKLFAYKVYMLTISLDGATAQTNDKIRGKGVFDLVCSNVKKINTARYQHNQYIRIITSPVLTQANKNEVEDFCTLALSLKFDSVIFTSLRRKGRAQDNFKDLSLSVDEEIAIAENIAILLSKGIKQHIQIGFGSPLLLEYLNLKYQINLPIIPGGCNALISKGYIQPNGNLYPCQELTDSFYLYREKKSITHKSLTHNSFDKIWSSSLYGDLLNRMFSMDMTKNNRPCNICKYLYTICYPCPLPSLRNNGEVQHETCLKILKKAYTDGIDLLKSQKVNMDLYSILLKATQDRSFRNCLFFDPKTSLENLNINYTDEDFLRLCNIINNSKCNIKNYLAKIGDLND